MTPEEFDLFLQQQQEKLEKRKNAPKPVPTIQGMTHPDTVTAINDNMSSQNHPSGKRIVGALGTELAIAIPGQMAASAAAAPQFAVPVYGWISGAVTYTSIAFGTGYAGNMAGQEVENPGGKKSYGKAVAAGLLNLIPGGSAFKGTKGAVGVTTRMLAEGGKGSVMAMGDLTISRLIDEGELPEFKELMATGILGAGIGTGLGGIVEAGTGIARKIKPKTQKTLNSIKDKTPDEIDAMVDSGELNPRDIDEMVEDVSKALEEKNTINPKDKIDLPESELGKQNRDRRKQRKEKRKEKEAKKKATKEKEELDEALTEEEGIEELDSIIEDYNNAKGTDSFPEQIPTFIMRFRRVFDAADEDFTTTLNKLLKNPDDTSSLNKLLDTLNLQEKTLVEGLGELNKAAGEGVRVNSVDVTRTDNLKHSVDTTEYLEAINKLKNSINKRLKGLDADDADFAKSLRETLADVDVKKTTRKKQQTKGTPENKALKLAQNKIKELNKKLEALRKRFGDDDVLDETGKPKKPTPDTTSEQKEIKELQEKINFYKKAEKEAKQLDKALKEVDRLTDIIARGDADEIAKELAKFKKGTINSRLKEARRQVTLARKTMRKQLKEIDDKSLKQDRMDFYNDVYQTQLALAKEDKVGLGYKIWNNLRIARKLGMVNSVTSIQAGIPTATFEILRQPTTIVGQFFADAFNKNLAFAARAARYEWAGAVESVKALFTKEHLKYMGRAFMEGKDPSFVKSEKLGFQQQRGSIFKSGNESRLYDLAKGNAKLQASSADWLLNWSTSQNPLSIIHKIYQIGKSGLINGMQIGKRGIVMIDSGAQRQLQIARARAKYGRMGLEKFPDDPAKAKAHAEKLFNDALKDVNGVNILDDVQNLQEEFAKISDNLLMASHLDIQDVEKSFTTKFTEWMQTFLNAKSGKDLFAGSVIEFFQPFFKIGVTTVQRGAKFAIPGAPAASGLFSQHKRVIKKHTEKRNHFQGELLKKMSRLKETPNNPRLKQEVEETTKLIADLERRIKNADVRRVRANAEAIGDTIIQGAIAGAGFGLGYAGLATGYNTWMTPDQRKGAPNQQNFHIFGMDYSSWVPMSLGLSMYADLGAYMRAKEEGRISKDFEGNWWTVMRNSINRAVAEVPFMQGYKQVLTALDPEKQENFWVRQIASYAPTMSQARKIAKQITVGDEMVDLRGGKWWERAIYHQYGFGVAARKYDVLGEPMQTGANWEQVYNRSAGKKFKRPTAFEEALGRDKRGTIKKVFPTSFDIGISGYNIDMTEWYDNKGRRLMDVVAEEIRKDGQLKRELDSYLRSGYRSQLDIIEQNKSVAEVRINKIISKHYKRIFTKLTNSSSFGLNIIGQSDNGKDITLREYVRQARKEYNTIRRETPPPSNNPILEDVNELTEAYSN